MNKNALTHVRKRLPKKNSLGCAFKIYS